MEIKVYYNDNEVIQLLQFLVNGIIKKTHTGWTENKNESGSEESGNKTTIYSYSIIIPNPTFVDENKKVEEGIKVVLNLVVKLTNFVGSETYNLTITDKSEDTLLYEINALNANTKKYAKNSVPVYVDYLYEALWTYLFGDEARAKTIKERINTIVNYDYSKKVVTYETNGTVKHDMLLTTINKLKDISSTTTYLNKVTYIHTFVRDRYYVTLSNEELLAITDIVNYAFIKSSTTMVTSLYDILNTYDTNTKSKTNLINLALTIPS